MGCYAADEALRSTGTGSPDCNLMFDIGWSEMAIIAVVALIVIGPRDLPRLLFTAGKLAAKARATLGEFQQGLAEMAREAELDELRKKIDAARDFSPEREITKALDPTGEIEADLDRANWEMLPTRSAAAAAADTVMQSEPRVPASLVEEVPRELPAQIEPPTSTAGVTPDSMSPPGQAPQTFCPSPTTTERPAGFDSPTPVKTAAPAAEPSHDRKSV